MNIAAIGSRDLPPEYERMMLKFGFLIGKKGWSMSTGGAIGSDLAWLNGFNRAKSFFNAYIYLPWESYNIELLDSRNNMIVIHKEEWVELAASHHPNWNNLKDSVKKLMTRNVGVVHNSNKVLYYVNPDSKTSGTKHAIKCAASLNIPCFNIHNKTELELIEFLKS